MDLRINTAVADVSLDDLPQRLTLEADRVDLLRLQTAQEDGLLFEVYRGTRQGNLLREAAACATAAREDAELKARLQQALHFWLPDQDQVHPDHATRALEDLLLLADLDPAVAAEPTYYALINTTP